MTPAKTSYHHGDLRAALLAAALEILHQQGPQQLSIRAVARKVGVSHTAPYRHFADKNELIVACVEQGFELMRQTMADKKAAADNDPLSQFAAAGMAYIEFALEHPTYYRVMYSGDLLSSTGRQSLQHTSAETYQELVEDIRTCQQLHILRPGDPMKQAITLLSTVHGFVTLVNDNRVSTLVGADYQLEDVRDFVMTAIFEGLSAPPPTVKSNH